MLCEVRSPASAQIRINAATTVRVTRFYFIKCKLIMGPKIYNADQYYKWGARVPFKKGVFFRKGLCHSGKFMQI